MEKDINEIVVSQLYVLTEEESNILVHKLSDRILANVTKLKEK